MNEIFIISILIGFIIGNIVIFTICKQLDKFKK